MRKIIFIIIALLLSTPAWADPLIIAHRGGRADWPENTLYAFQRAAQSGADAIELDIQLTKDGVPIVFHPRDLSECTNGKGGVGEHPVKYIKNLIVQTKLPVENGAETLRIPTLLEALKVMPNILLVFDLKSLPAEDLVRSIVKEVPEEEWKRIVVYSTNNEHIEWMKRLRPNVPVFEDRDSTRRRLLKNIASHVCEGPSDAKWIGFELKRDLDVTEMISLGESTDKIVFDMWTPESIRCVRKIAPHAKVIMFGVNSEESYKSAKKLGADGVYTDDPLKLLGHHTGQRKHE